MTTHEGVRNTPPRPEHENDEKFVSGRLGQTKIIKNRSFWISELTFRLGSGPAWLETSWAEFFGPADPGRGSSGCVPVSVPVCCLRVRGREVFGRPLAQPHWYGRAGLARSKCGPHPGAALPWRARARGSPYRPAAPGDPPEGPPGSPGQTQSPTNTSFFQ